MLTDQHTYDAQAHKIADAVAATVTNAQAGLNWLSAQSPDLDEVRKVLDSIVSNGKRAGEIIIQLRTLMDKVPAHVG